MSNLTLLSKLNLLALIVFTCFMGIAEAEESEQRILVKYGQQVYVDISAGNINRLNFYPYQISRVISDKPELSFEISDFRDNLFITPNLKPTTLIGMSVVLSNGMVVDLAIKVKDRSSPSIISFVFNHGAGEKRFSDLRREVNNMMQAMRSGHIGKYYVQNVGRKGQLDSIPQIDKDLRIKQTSLYRFENLSGGVFEVSNTNRRQAMMVRTSEIISSFKDIFKASFDKEILIPGEKSQFYIIWQKGEKK